MNPEETLYMQQKIQNFKHQLEPVLEHYEEQFNEVKDAYEPFDPNHQSNTLKETDKSLAFIEQNKTKLTKLDRINQKLGNNSLDSVQISAPKLDHLLEDIEKNMNREYKKRKQELIKALPQDYEQIFKPNFLESFNDKENPFNTYKAMKDKEKEQSITYEKTPTFQKSMSKDKNKNKDKDFDIDF